MAYKPKGPLGAGTRFAALEAELERRGAKNPRALAAWIGRKKYGKEKFQMLAARGRSRAAGGSKSAES